MLGIDVRQSALRRRRVGDRPIDLRTPPPREAQARSARLKRQQDVRKQNRRASDAECGSTGWSVTSAERSGLWQRSTDGMRSPQLPVRRHVAASLLA